MDHKQIKQLKKQAQAEKRRLSKLMNSASPGADWCGTFVKALEDDRVQGVSEAEQQTVRSWAARIEELRSTASANKSLEKLPLTDADKQLRVEVQLVQAKFPKHALTAVLKNTASEPLAPAEPIKKAPAAAPKEKTNADSDDEDDIADLKPEGMSASEWKKLKRKARKKERQARKAEKKQKAKGGDDGDDEDAAKKGKKDKKDNKKTQAEKDELAEDRRGAKYAAAGLIAYAVRRRAVPKNSAGHTKVNPNEIVVLMICEKRDKQVLNLPGGKVRMSEDHNDSNLTALREFSEETKLIWEYDMAAMEHRMRSEAPDLGLTRCMQQDGGYYLHFAQIPYIPNANKLLAEKKGTKLSAGAGEVAPDNTTGLFWVPLKTLLRAAKLKSIEVTVHPGATPPIFRRISLHRFVPELFRNRRIMEHVKLLNRLFAEGKIQALPMPDFAQPDVPDEQQPEQPEADEAGSDNDEKSDAESESDAEESSNDKKRKRDDMETDEAEPDAEADNKPQASASSTSDGPSDVFGSLSSNKLDLDQMDWDSIVGTVIESRTGGKGTLTAKGPLKKIVLQDLSKQVRSRLVSMLDGQLSKRTQYVIENGQIGPRPKKQKVE